MRRLLTILPVLFAATLVPAQPQSGGKRNPKVCVAEVANASTVSADLGRLTDRLVKSLKRGKMDAEAMESSTTMDRHLHVTGENAEEADSKRCDFTLLTQIVETRQHPAAPPSSDPRGRAGPAVPSVDASDTVPGSSSAPVYREEMEISFAVFQSSHHEPVVDTSVFDTASAGVSDSFQQVMDRVANRVTHELKKR